MPKAAPKWPSVWDNYAVPRHAPRFSARWSEANLITYIKERPHLSTDDIHYHLRVTNEHAKYLVLKSRQEAFRKWLKE